MSHSHSFSRILATHVERYPQMQIVDLVKLAYQAALGCEHLLDDESACGKALRRELAQNKPGPVGSTPLFEPISPLLARLNLGLVESFNLRWQTICRLFMLTGQTYRPDQEQFKKNLAQIRSFLKDIAPQQSRIPLCQFDTWLKLYQKDECPAVRHSAIYRAAYQPAYRVIYRSYERLLPLFSALDQLIRQNRPLLIAIDGKSAAGKSTLADDLKNIYGGHIIRMDDFFLRPGQRTDQRLAEPGGNIDYERFKDEVTARIRQKQTIRYRAYNCQTDSFGPTVSIEPSGILWVEGVYSQHPQWTDLFDFKIFLTISDREQTRRLEQRETKAQMIRFANEWVPLENNYFQSLSIEAAADLSITAE